MALTDELPPSTRPTGRSIERLLACFKGAVLYPQVKRPFNPVNPAGIWIRGWISLGPASSSKTEQLASSDSLAANTQPADPLPTIM
jgi:hypothetical protein